MAERKRHEYDEDLFKDTTMTFGEHLEELRGCLFKAILGLGVGFLLGLLVGGPVVQLIQDPLQKALTRYYLNQTTEDASLEKLKKAGYKLPEDPEDLKKLKKTIAEKKLIFEAVHVDPYELARKLKESDPKQLNSIPPPSDNPSDSLDMDRLVQVFIWHPIEQDRRVQAKSLNAHEAFVIYIKAAFLVGLLVSSPWVFYQIWSFVAAGLYPHEKRYIHVFLPFSVGLFLSGAALAFVFVLEPVLNFLFFFNAKLGIDPDPRISEWLGFVLILPLGFGISFQLPLVMLFLERIGIFDVKAYLSKWRIAILVICVLAMMLTPADPYSMLLMAVPLTFLYFGGILLCKYMPRSRSPFDDLEQEENKNEARTPEPSKGKRFWFVLRMAIVAILVLLLLFVWWARRKAREQEAAVAHIEEHGGTVFYDYQFDESGKRIEGARPSGWSVLRKLLGDDFFDTVVEVDLSGTKASDAALEPLKGLAGLKKLDLRGTKVTRQGVENLQAVLSDCKIVGDPNGNAPQHPAR